MLKFPSLMTTLGRDTTPPPPPSSSSTSTSNQLPPAEKAKATSTAAATSRSTQRNRLAAVSSPSTSTSTPASASGAAAGPTSTPVIPLGSRGWSTTMSSMFTTIPATASSPATNRKIATAPTKTRSSTGSASTSASVSGSPSAPTTATGTATGTGSVPTAKPSLLQSMAMPSANNQFSIFSSLQAISSVEDQYYENKIKEREERRRQRRAQKMLNRADSSTGTIGSKMDDDTVSVKSATTAGDNSLEDLDFSLDGTNADDRFVLPAVTLTSTVPATATPQDTLPQIKPQEPPQRQPPAETVTSHLNAIYAPTLPPVRKMSSLSLSSHHPPFYSNAKTNSSSSSSSNKNHNKMTTRSDSHSTASTLPTTSSITASWMSSNHSAASNTANSNASSAPNKAWMLSANPYPTPSSASASSLATTPSKSSWFASPATPDSSSRHTSIPPRPASSSASVSTAGTTPSSSRFLQKIETATIATVSTIGTTPKDYSGGTVCSNQSKNSSANKTTVSGHSSGASTSSSGKLRAQRNRLLTDLQQFQQQHDPPVQAFIDPLELARAHNNKATSKSKTSSSHSRTSRSRRKDKISSTKQRKKDVGSSTPLSSVSAASTSSSRSTSTQPFIYGAPLSSSSSSSPSSSISPMTAIQTPTLPMQPVLPLAHVNSSSSSRSGSNTRGGGTPKVVARATSAPLDTSSTKQLRHASLKPPRSSLPEMSAIASVANETVATTTTTSTSSDHRDEELRRATEEVQHLKSVVADLLRLLSSKEKDERLESSDSDHTARTSNESASQDKTAPPTRKGSRGLPPVPSSTRQDRNGEADSSTNYDTVKTTAQDATLDNSSQHSSYKYVDSSSSRRSKTQRIARRSNNKKIKSKRKSSLRQYDSDDDFIERNTCVFLQDQEDDGHQDPEWHGSRKYTMIQLSANLERRRKRAERLEHDCPERTGSSDNLPLHLQNSKDEETKTADPDTTIVTGSINEADPSSQKTIRHVRIYVPSRGWGYYSGPEGMTGCGCVVRFDSGDLYLGSMKNGQLEGSGSYYPKRPSPGSSSMSTSTGATGTSSRLVERGYFKENRLQPRESSSSIIEKKRRSSTMTTSTTTTTTRPTVNSTIHFHLEQKKDSRRTNSFNTSYYMLH